MVVNFTSVTSWEQLRDCGSRILSGISVAGYSEV